MIRVVIATAVAFSFVSVAPVATADAGCVHRGIGHADQHGGQAADDAYHIAHGEEPTCSGDGDYQGKRELDNVNEPNVGKPPRWRSRSNSNDDQKSHYCRKHWYC